MPLAVTLRLDDAATATVVAMWRALAEGGVDDDCLRLGYPPHVTLAVWPEEAPVGPLAAAVDLFGAAWGALPAVLAGFGVFPGAPAAVWAAPVVTGDCSRGKRRWSPPCRMRRRATSTTGRGGGCRT